jgi:hypothetical protein
MGSPPVEAGGVKLTVASALPLLVAVLQGQMT